MSSCVTGIGYSMWLRSRWVLLALGLAIGLLAVVVRMSASGQSIALYCTFVMCSAISHLLVVATLGPSDLGSRGSGYPKSMFVLPVRTTALVACPMLIAAISAALMWAALVVLVYRPAGIDLPLAWPGAIAAASIAWIQAIGWSPFASPFLRVPVIAVALGPLILLGTIASIYLESSGVSAAIACLSISWIGGAFLFGTRGLALARAGADPDWLLGIGRRLLNRIEAYREEWARTRGPFRSAARAHLSYELRRNAIVLPLMYVFVAVPMLVLILPGVANRWENDGFMVGEVLVPTSLLGLAVAVSVFLLLSNVYTMGKFDVWGKDELPAFFAVRPMSEAGFVAIKLVAAVCSSLAAWGVMLGVVALCAAVDVSPLNSEPSLLRSMIPETSSKTVTTLALVPFVLLAVSCRSLIVSLWYTLIGRTRVVAAIAVCSLASTGLFVYAAYWVAEHQDYVAKMTPYAPWLLGAMIAIKSVVAAVVVREVLARRLLAAGTLAKWLAAWIAVVAGICTLAACFTTLTPVVVEGALLAVPLGRVAAAPLALYANRHR